MYTVLSRATSLSGTLILYPFDMKPATGGMQTDLLREFCELEFVVFPALFVIERVSRTFFIFRLIPFYRMLSAYSISFSSIPPPLTFRLSTSLLY